MLSVLKRTTSISPWYDTAAHLLRHCALHQLAIHQQHGKIWSCLAQTSYFSHMLHWSDLIAECVIGIESHSHPLFEGWSQLHGTKVIQFTLYCDQVSDLNMISPQQYLNPYLASTKTVPVFELVEDMLQNMVGGGGGIRQNSPYLVRTTPVF